MDIMKCCVRCGVEYPATAKYFSPRENGFYPACRKCRNKTQSQRNQTPEVKTYLRAYRQSAKCKAARKAYEQSPEFKAKRKAYQQDPGRKAAQRAYEQTEKYKAKQRAYERSAKGKVREKTHNHRRKALKRALPAAFTAADWQRAVDYFNGCCAVCGRPSGLWHTLAADHWIPLSDPRPDNPGTVPWNIVPLCHGADGCNNSKHDYDAQEWLTKKLGAKKAKAKAKEIQAYLDSVK